MKKSIVANFVALAVVVAFLFLFVGLTAHAEMKVGSFKNLQSAEKAMVGKKDKVFYPSKDGQALSDAMRQSPGMSLDEARAFDKNHEGQGYLVMWEESGTGNGGSGKKTVSEEKVRYVEKPAPAPAPEPPAEVVQEVRRPQKKGFFGQLFGSILTINVIPVVQPTVVGERYEESYGEDCVPEFVPQRRVYYNEPTYCLPVVCHRVYYNEPDCRPERTTYCPPPRTYCPPSYRGGHSGGGGGRNTNTNTNVVNNEVRVQVQREGSSTRSSSGPTFARGDTTRDPAGPTRSSGSSSHHR